MVKRLKKDALDFSKGTLATSVGTGVVSTTGASLGGTAGTAATKGAVGMGKMASFFPAMGAMLGGAGVTRMLGKLQKKQRRKI